jgi:ribosomal protein L40E
VLCSWCGTKLPDGSQFCLKCGQKAAAAENAATTTIPARSICSKCGTSLPADTSSCLKCGQPVMPRANSEALSRAVAEASAFLRFRRQSRILVWSLAAVLLAALLWVATSQNPAAQEVQEFVHWSQVQTIVDGQAAVNPGSFWSHEFTVPAGALDVSITGEFRASAVDSRHAGSKVTETAKSHDNGVEVYVLTNSAFVVWSGGYSSDALYQSGSTAGDIIDASLPGGAGVYHLVFSNRPSPSGKTVHATVLLRYKSGWPNAILRLKERLWEWIG